MTDQSLQSKTRKVTHTTNSTI